MIGRYKVFRGDVLLGNIQEETLDFPWTLGTFTPTSDFEPVRPLFDALSSSSSLQGRERMREFELAWCRIATPDLRLVPDEPGEPTITEFILHINGNRFQLRS